MSSNSDSEDSDFVPDLAPDDSEGSVLSESDEDDEKDPDETDKKISKRKGVVKSKKSKKSKAKRRRHASEDTDEEKSDWYNEGSSKNQTTELSEEERKSKVDLLWNDFLSDVATPAKKNTNTVDKQSSSEESKAQTMTNKESKKPKEIINDETKVIAEVSKLKKGDTSSSASVGIEKKTLTQLTSNIARPGIRRSGGISSILSSISKKPKMSVLEKSKMDWKEFKQEHNLNEEITTFNRGKNGYLERQDFLERTDSRQFEMEKEMRNKNRKKL